MKYAKHLYAGIALSATLAPSLSAQDKKLTREQLPAPVLATADRETKGASIKGYGSERENGKLSYEVESVVNGHTRDLAIAPDGTLTEVEEELALDSLDIKVHDALIAKAKGAQITKVESLTKAGKLVAYEAATLKNGHKGEIQVSPTGETLKRPQ